ncbi:V-SNARE coiled-coil homology domain-containing protein [Plasmodiophora brassicae]|uniref:V-SNARE coiled-coil homology domain-containing protein n=1 Tax=Plasmodiophora brassicae TaxID=37360 RepID=A0A0G4IR15_PLABS|nr:hypothetical protein PBRA_000953 [Plasmodiophora brassicae]SPQ97905.1 unnamed protein product [Plasmodiophora brassicae]
MAAGDVSPDDGGILYALVARDTDVLAEYAALGVSGNFSQVTRVLLSRIDSQKQGPASYVLDGYYFHYLISKGVTCLCMADQSCQSPFDFLDDIKARFTSAYGSSANTAIAYAFNAEFSNVLRNRMEYFNKLNRSQTKISAVQSELNQARNVMVENIDRVLERGDRIELLVDKSERLDASALQFRKRATVLKRSMWWKNVKAVALMVFVILVVVYVILSIACGGPGLSQC